MELAGHSGHLYFPLSATYVVPSCGTVEEGVSSYHTAEVKGHRMEKGGLLAELSSLCRSKWLQLSLSPH